MKFLKKVEAKKEVTAITYNFSVSTSNKDFLTKLMEFLKKSPDDVDWNLE